MPFHIVISPSTRTNGRAEISRAIPIMERQSGLLGVVFIVWGVMSRAGLVEEKE